MCFCNSIITDVGNLFLGNYILLLAVIDISTFPDLTIRDAEWIELILRETKYETIARKYNLSEGTVKNNFARIFRILNVSDRIHFLSVYGGCKVIYGNTKHIKVSTFLRDVYWTK